MTWKPLPSDDCNDTGVTLKSALGRLAVRLGVPSAETFGSVLSLWPEVVGEEIARHTQPCSLAAGVLTVWVDDSRWTTQLKWLGPQLVDRLNDATGSEEVHRLEVRLQTSASPK